MGQINVVPMGQTMNLPAATKMPRWWWEQQMGNPAMAAMAAQKQDTTPVLLALLAYMQNQQSLGMQASQFKDMLGMQKERQSADLDVLKEQIASLKSAMRQNDVAFGKDVFNATGAPRVEAARNAVESAAAIKEARQEMANQGAAFRAAQSTNQPVQNAADDIAEAPLHMNDLTKEYTEKSRKGIGAVRDAMKTIDRSVLKTDSKGNKVVDPAAVENAVSQLQSLREKVNNWPKETNWIQSAWATITGDQTPEEITAKGLRDEIDSRIYTYSNQINPTRISEQKLANAEETATQRSAITQASADANRAFYEGVTSGKSGQESAAAASRALDFGLMPPRRIVTTSQPASGAPTAAPSVSAAVRDPIGSGGKYDPLRSALEQYENPFGQTTDQSTETPADFSSFMVGYPSR